MGASEASGKEFSIRDEFISKSLAEPLYFRQ